jgi:hypothetical protein
MRLPYGLLLSALLIAPRLSAVEGLELHLDTLAGAGWRAQHITLQLDMMDIASARLHLAIGQLELPEPVGTIKNLQLDCAPLQLRNDEIDCAKAQLRLTSALLDRDHSTVAFSYRPVQREITLTVRDARMASGNVTLTAHSDDSGWKIDYDLVGIDLARLPPYLKQQAGLTSASGRASLHGSLSGADSIPDAFSIQAEVTALAFATPDGANAGEALNVQGTVSGRRHGEDWQAQGELTLHDGTLCIKNCWELPADPLTLDATASWSGLAQRLDVTRLHFRQTSLGQGDATLRLLAAKTPMLNAFTLRLAPTRWERLYTTYLQPLLIGTALEAVAVQGSVAADIDYRADALSTAHVQLGTVALEDHAGRFGIKGLGGMIDWRSDMTEQQSELHWDAAHVYKLTLGAASVQAQSRGQSLHLLQTVHLPILDGQLDIEHFALQRGAGKPLNWQFDGLLKPVSMQAFSTAIGWPEMHGKLSGMIPNVSYAEGELRVGGMLLIRAFDGAITVRDLRIARLFDVAPSLRADITLDNLDLDALTRAFSFGNIQGRFSGQVDNLQLIDWRPVAFAARFATPADDRSRHRISQRAVENISQIGGGGLGGALSRSFLRVFDEFSYDRIGISCTLSNGVCMMDGVAPAQQGYYLVKGGGLPRIDIIGYAHRVDWDTLLERIGGVISNPSMTREPQ